MKILIHSGEVVNPGGASGRLDVLLEDGKVIKMAEHIVDDTAQQVDASGKYVFPGLLDMHVHLREPGFEYKETILSGTRAAVAGGFTAVACMPNTAPVIDSEDAVRRIYDRAAKAGYARVYPIAAITKGQKGQELTEMGFLQQAGAVGFSDDGNPVVSDLVMRNAMVYAKNFDALLLSHCENLTLVNGGAMNEGYASTMSGLRGNTRAAEETMIAREIILAQTYAGKVHICHVSTAYGFELVRQAKARGVRVTCETCPHYFTLTDEACMGFDTNTKMNPPLRTEADRQAAIAAIADGTVDAIVTDHAPHHIDDKDVEFDMAANGISGLETSLALGYMYLVQTGAMDVAHWVERMSVLPARILGVDMGVLHEGGRADVTVFDPQKQWTVRAEELQTKGKNTPYLGWELTGKASDVFVDGRHVVRDYKMVD